jgi:hypothetical protein
VGETGDWCGGNYGRDKGKGGMRKGGESGVKGCKKVEKGKGRRWAVFCHGWGGWRSGKPGEWVSGGALVTGRMGWVRKMGNDGHTKGGEA